MLATLWRDQGLQQRHLCLVSHGCRKNDGQSRVNYEIVKAALGKGWRVTFIGKSLSEDLRHAPSLRWLRIKSSSIPTVLLQNLVFAAQASALIESHRDEFDIIHTNGFIVWSKSSVNTVHFVHSGWIRNHFFPYVPARSLYSLYQYFYTLLNSYLERYAFKNSVKLVAVSENVKVEINATGLPESKLTVIPNGVDLDEFHPGLVERAKYSLPEGSTLFLFAGDIRTKRKNLESVLEAVSLVSEIHLVVAGTLERSPYPDLAKKLGVYDRVHFLGLISDMPCLMRSVDAFVFPSRYDPFGLVILEALASGLPVITASTAGAADIIGKGGLVVSDPDDVQELANSIQLITTDVELRLTMGRTAREVATSLSWSVMTERYFQIYDKYLQSLSL